MSDTMAIAAMGARLVARVRLTLMMVALGLALGLVGGCGVGPRLLVLVEEVPRETSRSLTTSLARRHAKMLASRGILSEADADAICRGLDQVQAEWERGERSALARAVQFSV